MLTPRTCRAQLRYYWDEEADNCKVRQTNASFWYGYEYLGAQMRLVVTPMTGAPNRQPS